MKKKLKKIKYKILDSSCNGYFYIDNNRIPQNQDLFIGYNIINIKRHKNNKINGIRIYV